MPWTLMFLINPDFPSTKKKMKKEKKIPSFGDVLCKYLANSFPSLPRKKPNILNYVFIIPILFIIVILYMYVPLGLPMPEM